MPAFQYKKRGWRQFLNLAIRLSRFTSKHQQNIKDEGPAETDALLLALINILAQLIALQEPGPN